MYAIRNLLFFMFTATALLGLAACGSDSKTSSDPSADALPGSAQVQSGSAAGVAGSGVKGDPGSSEDVAAARAAISGFIDAMMQNDRPAGYAYLSSADQQALSAEQYLQMDGLFTRLAPATSDASEYRIDSVVVAGDTAVANVVITAPDRRAIETARMEAAMVEQASGGAVRKEDIIRTIEDNLREGDFPLLSVEAVYNLVRESGNWKVVLEPARQ